MTETDEWLLPIKLVYRQSRQYVCDNFLSLIALEFKNRRKDQPDRSDLQIGTFFHIDNC